MTICPTCGKTFDPADRAAAGRPGNGSDSAADRILYCSEKCQRTMQNKKNYLRHRAERLAKAKKKE